MYNTTFAVCNGSKLVSVEINSCSTHVLCYHISSVFPFLWKQFPRTNQFWLGDAGKNRRSTANPFLKFRSCTSDLHLENIRTPYSVSQKAKREKKETQNKKQRKKHQQLAEQITLQDSSDFHQSIGKLHLCGKRRKKKQKGRKTRLE